MPRLRGDLEPEPRRVELNVDRARAPEWWRGREVFIERTGDEGAPRPLVYARLRTKQYELEQRRGTPIVGSYEPDGRHVRVYYATQLRHLMVTERAASPAPSPSPSPGVSLASSTSPPPPGPYRPAPKLQPAPPPGAAVFGPLAVSSPRGPSPVNRPRLPGWVPATPPEPAAPAAGNPLLDEATIAATLELEARRQASKRRRRKRRHHSRRRAREPEPEPSQPPQPESDGEPETKDVDQLGDYEFEEDEIVDQLASLDCAAQEEDYDEEPFDQLAQLDDDHDHDQPTQQPSQDDLDQRQKLQAVEFAIAVTANRQAQHTIAAKAAKMAHQWHRRRKAQQSPKLPFLRSIPLFQALTAGELEALAAGAGVAHYEDGDFIVREATPPPALLVLWEGVARVSSEELGGLGVLRAGDYVGDVQPQAASARSAVAEGAVTCIAVTRDQLLAAVSHKTLTLLESIMRDEAPTASAQQLSLTRHVDKVAELLAGGDDVRLDLLTAFSPELDLDDIIERTVQTVYRLFDAERVGLFIVNGGQQSMTLKVSRQDAGVTLPLTGLAGATATTGRTINVPDAYDDPRFSPDMDRRTNFRTKAVVCKPVLNARGEVAAVLQVINKRSGASFSRDDAELLGVVAEQLGAVLSSGRNKTPSSVPLQTIRSPFQLCVKALQHAPPRAAAVRVQLFHGGLPLAPPVDTAPDGGWYQLAVLLCNVPHAARLIFSVVDSSGAPVAWAGLHVFRFDHRLLSGDVDLSLFPGACPTPSATSLENKASGGDVATLRIELPSFPHAVSYDPGAVDRPPAAPTAAPADADLALMRRIVRDPLRAPSAGERALFWQHRAAAAVTGDAAALPKFLLSVNWADCAAVAEARHALYQWEPPGALQALQLLDFRFPDPVVRAFAVHRLALLADAELRPYLLQLVQALKFEPFHDSALARFLLHRALADRRGVGHKLFWYLKAEMHVADVRDRFALMISLYLRSCGEHRQELGQQMFVMQQLEGIANSVAEQPTKAARVAALREQLAAASFPERFQLPLDPDIVVTGVVVERCRVMDSKKKPLWLEFLAEGRRGNYVVMFKAGDDLRQDQLTLQVLAIMDELWKAEGLDLRMSAYGCVSTGDEVGMLEIVENSDTLANIVSGSTKKTVSAALKPLNSKKTLYKWIVSNAAASSSALRGGAAARSARRRGGVLQAAGALNSAIDNFARSCAGYCVATYVLGIGDRHNDNIMLKKTGEFFHIDFGHFLGNFKSKFGIRRERAPFVFTPMMQGVLNRGEDGPSDAYHAFVDTACRAFNVIRKHSSLVVTLFSLMLSCGIPELQTEEDIAWLNESLMVDVSDRQAAQRFEQLIDECLASRATGLNHAVHILAHG